MSVAILAALKAYPAAVTIVSQDLVVPVVPAVSGRCVSHLAQEPLVEEILVDHVLIKKSMMRFPSNK